MSPCRICVASWLAPNNVHRSLASSLIFLHKMKGPPIGQVLAISCQIPGKAGATIRLWMKPGTGVCHVVVARFYKIYIIYKEIERPTSRSIFDHVFELREPSIVSDFSAMNLTQKQSPQICTHFKTHSRERTLFLFLYFNWWQLARWVFRRLCQVWSCCCNKHRLAVESAVCENSPEFAKHCGGNDWCVTCSMMMVSHFTKAMFIKIRVWLNRSIGGRMFFKYQTESRARCT